MILTGDCLEILPTLDAESAQCCVTSPPYYGLRDYGCEGQIGLEPTPEAYVGKLVAVFREVQRVMRPDATLWLNLGDTYSRDPGKGDRADYLGLHKNIEASGCHHASQHRTMGTLKPKDLIGIPWRVAFALQADGWYLRQDIIWAKPNPMPESVTDRCTKAHEYIFLLTKSARYFYDKEAILESQVGDEKTFYAKRDKQAHKNLKGGVIGWHVNANGKDGLQNAVYNPNGRNRRSVWTITTKPFKEAHFATFPPEIPEICIKAGTSEKGCCPECGSPWERMLKRIEAPAECFTKTRTPDDGFIGGHRKDGEYRGSGQKYQNWLNEHPPTTIGWRPTCACHRNDLPYPPIPCTVLDPFSGAGTAGNVAERLGRKYIGIELNPAYSEMAEKRIDAARLPLFEK